MASCKWTRWRGRGYCSRDCKVLHIFTIIILIQDSWKICFNFISSLCHDLCLQRTNGRVLPAQWKLLPPSKRNCSDSSEGLNFDAGASKTSFCRRRQRHQLLPLVHTAEHEEEDVHLLLPLVQVTMQSKPVPLNYITKTQPTNVITF